MTGLTRDQAFRLQAALLDLAVIGDELAADDIPFKVEQLAGDGYRVTVGGRSADFLFATADGGD